MTSAQDVIAFWFSERVKPLWFNATPDFDQELTEHFLSVYRAAADGTLSDWEESPQGALALVIVLDQFPLNLFRNQPESFATEAESRLVAERAIAKRFDQTLKDEHKIFLYMPFMHSEALDDQDRSVVLYDQAGSGLAENLNYAHHHREIVRRFGRFPHRNAILGRDSTPEETAYLNSKEAFLG